MRYKKLGLVNTRDMFADANAYGYAIGAFNFYNMETLTAILAAARATHSPVILAISESAIDYIGYEMLMAMIRGANINRHEQIALHLDHGHSYESCARAIDMGFSSVMIDASNMSFEKNIELTKRVVKYAHRYNVSVEAELGAIAGFEDKNTHSSKSIFTDPVMASEFVVQTRIDSLAVAIGTSHGAYKRKYGHEKLRFDILSEIDNLLPGFPIVLHGASTVPGKFVRTINNNGGDINGANGIPPAQLRHAVKMNVCKINQDTDNRLAFTAALRKNFTQHPDTVNPREYLGMAKTAVYENTVNAIINIMNSANKLKH